MFPLLTTELLEKKYGRYIKKIFFNLSKNAENSQDYYQHFMMDWHTHKYAQMIKNGKSFKNEREFLSYLSRFVKNGYLIYARQACDADGHMPYETSFDELVSENVGDSTGSRRHPILQLEDESQNSENIEFQVMFSELMEFIEVKSKRNPDLREIFSLLVQEYSLADIAEETSKGMKKNNTPLKNPRASSHITHKVNELRKLARAYFSS